MSKIVRESKRLFHENPISLLLEVQEAIDQGYRVENIIAGYPMLNTILKEITVFKPIEDVPKPAPLVPAPEAILIQEYEPMVFMLSVQKAILQGYRVDAGAVSFDTLKVANLIKATDVIEDGVQEDTSVVQEDAPKTARGRKASKKETV